MLGIIYGLYRGCIGRGLGFSRTWGTCFGVPIMRIIVFGGPYEGQPIWGSEHVVMPSMTSGGFGRGSLRIAEGYVP